MNCKNDAFMRKVAVEKLDNKVEVDFDVQRFLPDCRKIRTDKYVSTEATAPTYNRYRIPANQFECMNMNCVNSGTLFNEGAKTIYRAEGGEDFASGVITFYVTGDVTSAEVTISDTQSGTNADKYTVVPGPAVNGYKAVVVDLTQNGTEVGTGWTPSDGYTYIAISLTGNGETGLSSIAIYDDMEDFQTSTHVKGACVTSIDGSWDLEVAENACMPNNYDTSSNRSFEKTLTFTKATPNFWRLNPLYKRGSTVNGFDIVTVERTVKSADTFGSVTIEDMKQDECRWFSVMLADSPCIVDQAQLEKLNMPMSVALDEKHYVLTDAGNGVTTVLFNREHIGAKVLISYPKVASVEEFILSDDAINEIRTSLSYVKKHSDGEKYRFVFNKVLVTSFSDALGTDEDSGAFTITVSIQKDENGVFGHAYRILD